MKSRPWHKSQKGIFFFPFSPREMEGHTEREDFPFLARSQLELGRREKEKGRRRNSRWEQNDGERMKKRANLGIK